MVYEICTDGIPRLCLSGTSEIALAGLCANRVLPDAMFPVLSESHFSHSFSACKNQASANEANNQGVSLEHAGIDEGFNTIGKTTDRGPFECLKSFIRRKAIGLCASSRCFREEISHQSQPLYRVHQFTKVRTYSIVLTYMSAYFRMHVRLYLFLYSCLYLMTY
ncbi:unnamed protein product [Protopolystoma xenopodis]|uniref:Uncharacterized protein n=1 Tax=Protopolystoma xenopodis TaxID=117903 RepID=A0A448XR93_9PLAT|nr:unnamed protein product [Protopolystoma xenopodis]